MKDDDFTQPLTNAESTMLRDAATQGDIERIRGILKPNTSITQADGEKSALWSALGNKHIEAAFLILKHHKSVVNERHSNYTLLQGVIFNTKDDLRRRLISIFQEKGLSFESPWQEAICKNDLLRLKECDIQVREEFDSSKNTPLHYAAAYGFTHILEYLLENGAQVSKENGNGDTALHMAARNNHVETIKLLIRNGAQVNEKNVYKNTAQHIAAFHGNVEAIRCLLENGAQVNEKNGGGDTALHMAARNNRVETIKLLIRNGAQVNEENGKNDTALHMAARNNHVETIKLLILNGAQVNEKNVYKSTALYVAAFHGHVEAIRCLLENGAQVNEKIRSGDRDTALHAAVRNGHTAVVRFLVEHGANVHEKNMNGDTALHYAAFKGHVEVIKLLIEKGAQVNKKNVDDDTALHYAAFKAQHDAVVHYLIHSICEKNAPYPGGFNALLNACTHNSPIMNILRAWLLENKISIAARLGDHACIENVIKILDLPDERGLYPIDYALYHRDVTGDVTARNLTLNALFNKGCRNSLILERHGFDFEKNDTWKTFYKKVHTLMEKPRGNPLRAMVISLALQKGGVPPDVIQMILSYTPFGLNQNLGRFGFPLIPRGTRLEPGRFFGGVNGSKISKWLLEEKKESPKQLSDFLTGPSQPFLEKIIVSNNPEKAYALTLEQLLKQLESVADEHMVGDMKRILTFCYYQAYPSQRPLDMPSTQLAPTRHFIEKLNRLKIQRWVEAKESRLTFASTSAAFLGELIALNDPAKPHALTLEQLLEQLEKFYRDRRPVDNARPLDSMKEILRLNYNLAYTPKPQEDDGKQEMPANRSS